MMLLTIITPPAMEEELIDWLLSQQPNITGFTSQAANGHGSDHEMTLAEQVTGRRHQITFMIELQRKMAESILIDLKHEFTGCGLYYWLMPLSESGRL